MYCIQLAACIVLIRSWLYSTDMRLLPNSIEIIHLHIFPGRFESGVS